MSLLAILLKPFVAVAILVPIRIATEILRTKMPEGKLKRVLFSPLTRQSRGGH
jgi:hypothetical protein